jgi:hypothetical protein
MFRLRKQSVENFGGALVVLEVMADLAVHWRVNLAPCVDLLAELAGVGRGGLVLFLT